MKTFDEEDERLWEQWSKRSEQKDEGECWEDMRDAQLEEKEEEAEYNAADDQYDNSWDDELWEEEVEEETESWIWDEKGTRVERRRKRTRKRLEK